MEHPIKMDDLGVPLFLETPIKAIYKVTTRLNRLTSRAPPCMFGMILFGAKDFASSAVTGSWPNGIIFHQARFP